MTHIPRSAERSPGSVRGSVSASARAAGESLASTNLTATEVDDLSRELSEAWELVDDLKQSREPGPMSRKLLLVIESLKAEGVHLDRLLAQERHSLGRAQRRAGELSIELERAKENLDAERQRTEDLTAQVTNLLKRLHDNDRPVPSSLVHPMQMLTAMGECIRAQGLAGNTRMELEVYGPETEGEGGGQVYLITAVRG